MEKSLIKPFIAKRVAQEFTDGMVVNLGIGLPVLCTSFLPEGIHVTVHSELGIVGQGPDGPRPLSEEEQRRTRHVLWRITRQKVDQSMLEKPSGQ